MKDYFVPMSKCELVRWLSHYWPETNWKAKGKGVLYGIYFKTIANIKLGIYPNRDGTRQGYHQF